MKSLREPAPQRQSPTAVDDVLELGAELADADPMAHLSGAARELLKAYVELAEEAAGSAERPGASWARDAEVARRIGSSVSTVRRARAELAAGDAPQLRVEYVAPFHRLPSGEPSLHGTNVVTVLGLMGSAQDAEKSAPRAVVAARGALQPPTGAEIAMGNIREEFRGSQGVSLEERFGEEFTKMTHYVQDVVGKPLRGRVDSLDEQMRDMRTELGVIRGLLEQLVAAKTEPPKTGSGGGSGSGAGGGSDERHAVSHIGKKPHSHRVHIMPQLGDSPERSPTSSVEFVLPRAA